MSNAQAKGKSYRIFVRDLEMIASVGVYEFEKVRPQRIRVSIDLTVGPRPLTAARPPGSAPPVAPW